MRYRIVACVILGLLILPTVSRAATAFFTVEADWLASVGNVSSFQFTAANVALATEIASPPPSNTDLTATLTFSDVTTGLPHGFSISALQSGRVLVFEESPALGPLSVGRGSGTDNDDFDVLLLSGAPLMAFAFDLYQNDSGIGDSLLVFDSTDQLIAGISDAEIPSSPGLSDQNPVPAFLGIVSDEPIGRIRYDGVAPTIEGADNIGIGRFQFAIVPEPSTFMLLGIGLVAIAARRTKGRAS